MSTKKTVLLVDDDPAFIETSTIVLECKFNVRAAQDGRECIAEVKKEKPDLIIIDVMMRYLSEGLDVAKELKANTNFKNIPIIMLTGVSGGPGDEKQSFADLWLEKPVTPDRLIKEVGSILAGS